MQETFWDDKFIENYKHLWEGTIFYNNYKNNRRGVAILISKDCPYTFTFDSCDNEGRILKLASNIENNTYYFINIYAPNKIEEKIIFLKHLEIFVNNENYIIAGDFNEILDPHLDIGIQNKTFNLESSNALNNFKNRYDLIDIWRYRNRGKREYTRSQTVQNVLKQSRIDLILISKNVLHYVVNPYISYTTFSDHNFVCINIDFSNIERGQGIWIFNNNLLQDENFCDAVINIINNACQCPLFESEPLVW